MQGERPLSAEFAFTLTLKPRLYSFKPENQLEQSVLYIESRLARLGKYTLVWELTKDCNIHYHGMIKMYMDKGPVRMRWFNKWRGSALVGFTCFKLSDDIPGWVAYMGKTMEENREILPLTHHDPLIRDELALGQ